MNSIERLRAYFNVVPCAVEDKTLVELSEKVRGNLPFDQRTIDLWRQAETAVNACQRLFGQLQDQSVLPRQGERVLAQMPSLRASFQAAETSVIEALRRLEGIAATDTLQAIRRLIREV